MFLFASQLRSLLAAQRSLDWRPAPSLRAAKHHHHHRAPHPAAAAAAASAKRHDSWGVVKARATRVTTTRATRCRARLLLGAMTLCKFYAQGNCRFGAHCRFEHPTCDPTQNRFGVLAGVSGTAKTQDVLTKYNIIPDVVEKDLTLERPAWILSAYAPGRNSPDQLFGGYPREQSFEEMRLHYTVGKASGNEELALAQAQELYENARRQIETAARNVSEVGRFMAQAENKHPNRHDICHELTQGAPFGEFSAHKRSQPAVASSGHPNPFATGLSSTSLQFGSGPSPASTFGQPSAMGQAPSAFKPAAFGQPAQPSAAGFGQPSQPASAFGQHPQPAASFGQAPQPAAAFGRPSTLGPRPNPFAAQPGLPAQRPNPFATISSATTPASSNPFSTTTNGNINNTNVQNTPAAPSNPFGAQSQPSQSVNPFASTPNQAPTNNAPSAFGQPAQPSAGPFSQPSAAPANPFAQQLPSAPPQQKVNGAAPSSNNPYPPDSNEKHPPLETYSSRGMDGRLAIFKGQPVVYKDGQAGHRAALGGRWTKIWFPNGPPPYTKDTELRPEDYDDKSKALWGAFAQSGSFADSIMPELPPPRVCTRWDF